MENRGYFDNSATTKPCREAAEAVMNAVENGWGNPSSLHFIGSEAESILEDARASVAGAPAKKRRYISPRAEPRATTSRFSERLIR